MDSDTESPPSISYPKSQLLRSIVRPVSAPVNLSVPESAQHSSLPSTIPQSSPESNQSLLSELPQAQSNASRLRRERDTWRSLALQRSQNLETTYQGLQTQAQLLSQIEQSSANLRAEHEDATATNTHLRSEVSRLEKKYNKLVDDLNEAKRTIIRLRRSDRSKDKIQQRKLRLKALLKHCSSQAIPATTPSPSTAAKKDSALRDALDLAMERIEELEQNTAALLDALEKRDEDEGRGTGASAGNKGKGGEASENDIKLIEAKVMLRSILDDEYYGWQKDVWRGLLGE